MPPRKATTSPTFCQPLFATKRNFDRPTLGPQVAKIARALGKPLMPWQQLVADVALEVLPSGLLAYRSVGVTVPRQSGKTTLGLPIVLHRSFANFRGGLLDGDRPQRQSTVYTAQTRNDARKKWMKDWRPIVDASSLASKINTRLVNGGEGWDFPNGSSFDLMATMEKSGHGDVVDLGLLDEIFAQQDSRLQDAVTPSMNTRLMAQLWWWSTVGYSRADSPFMSEKCDAGRAAAQDPDSTVAYFEWAVPDDEDWTDDEVVARYHPAVGHTITVETIRAGRELKEAGFRRAFCNQWGAGRTPGVIPITAWDDLVDEAVAVGDPCELALDISPDRSRASLVAVGRAVGSNTAAVCADLVDNRPGVDWIVTRLGELRQRWGFARVALDAGAAAGSLAEDIEAAGFEVVRYTTRDVIHAAGRLYDRVLEGSIVHPGDPVMHAAVEGAVRRDIGDAWAFGRRLSAVDITPVVAMSLALLSFESRDPEPPASKPVFAY